MLVIAPKDNLARTFPSRVAVVIESSRGGAVTPFSFEDDLAGRSENIAPGRIDQVTERWRQTRVERSATMAAG
jgi:carbon monoxide dehydrogenase subunit G